MRLKRGGLAVSDFGASNAFNSPIQRIRQWLIATGKGRNVFAFGVYGWAIRFEQVCALVWMGGRFVLELFRRLRGNSGGNFFWGDPVLGG